MLAPATMRHCNNALLAIVFAGAFFPLSAQQPAKPAAPDQAPPLTVDRDPVRSPDKNPPPAEPSRDSVQKESSGFVLHTDVEEVVLNATILDDKGHLVQTLGKDDFQVFEDGVKQTIISFQHSDLPVAARGGWSALR